MHFAIYASFAAIAVILLVFAFILGANVAQPVGMKHWFERFQEFIAAMIGLVSAVGLGIAAWISVQRQLQAQERIQAEGRKDKQSALAHSLLMKLNYLVSNQYSIWKVLSAAKKDILENNLEPWQRFQPLANIPEKIYFSNEELGLVFSLKENEVFNSVLELDRFHNNTIDVLHALNAAQQKLTEALPAPEKYDGMRGLGTVPSEVIVANRPRMMNVNSLFEQEYDGWNSRHITSFNAMKRLAVLFNEKNILGAELSTQVEDFKS